MPHRPSAKLALPTILFLTGLLSIGHSNLAFSQTSTWSAFWSRPTISLAASPQSVASGSPATLAWSTTDARRCTASGAWSGSKATQGNSPTGPLTSSSTFTLTCWSYIFSARASATVTVAGNSTPGSTVAITASPTSVASGGSSSLAWSSSNATSCAASGAWSGSRATAGSASTGALTATTSFTLTCTGAGGSASRDCDSDRRVEAPRPSRSPRIPSRVRAAAAVR